MNYYCYCKTYIYFRSPFSLHGWGLREAFRMPAFLNKESALALDDMVLGWPASGAWDEMGTTGIGNSGDSP
jgi:hypothetical protein